MVRIYFYLIALFFLIFFSQKGKSTTFCIKFLCWHQIQFRDLIIFLSEVVAGFTCPIENGYFPDPQQCDAYFSCKGGLSERKLCPAGLFFDDRTIYYPRYPCTYPQDVQCGSRTRTRKSPNIDSSLIEIESSDFP